MMKITRYEEIFAYLMLPIDDKIKYKIRELNNEGYSEKCISYALFKAKDKLMGFRKDDRFLSIMVNEVRKHAFKNDYKYKCKYFN